MERPGLIRYLPGSNVWKLPSVEPCTCEVAGVMNLTKTCCVCWVRNGCLNLVLEVLTVNRGLTGPEFIRYKDQGCYIDVTGSAGSARLKSLTKTNLFFKV